MDNISRREFISLSVTFLLLSPLHSNATSSSGITPPQTHPLTISGLKKAHRSEMIAHEHYLGYVDKALTEKYPNIAYMFYAFSLSEKIHADNYQRVLETLESKPLNTQVPITVRDTKSNLKTASEKELEKIETFYPKLLKELEPEAHEEAIINSMYAWKSHRQHEAKVKEIRKYSKYFFGSVARRIEGLNLDFHICEICGSTLDKVPQFPCEICNKSILHYERVAVPG